MTNNPSAVTCQDQVGEDQSRVRSPGEEARVYERIGSLWLERKQPIRAPTAGRVLLVHGMWGGSWYWGGLLPRFAEAGWDTWAVNLRGHHGSDPGVEVGGVSIR